MSETLAPLIVALAAFLISHIIPSTPPIRAALVRTLGRNGYIGLYSLLSIGLMVWVALAFQDAPPGPLLWWLGPTVGPLIAVVVMPVAFILLVAGISQPNPTAVGPAETMPGAIPVHGALRITRHPLMWSFALWGLVHLAANGEARTVLLFGMLTLLALAGPLLIDMKMRRRDPDGYGAIMAQTSNFPFLAIFRGHQTFGRAVKEIGWIRLLIAIVLYGGMLHGHASLFGLSPLPATY